MQQPNYDVLNICESAEVSNGIFRLSVKGKFNPRPGQFYMVRGWKNEPLLSRPLSVHDADDERIRFLYQLKGQGTDSLSKLGEGRCVELLGPLGNGFDTDRFKGKVAVVAGGIGIAPMLYTVKKLKGAEVDVYAGFREDVYAIDEIKKHVKNVYVATENGRYGYKGYVTEIFSPWEYNAVLCCGPEIMMERIVKMCNDYATPVYVSLESHMACGIGACLVCTCKTVDGNKRTCKDGPVFSGREVILSV